jgi:Flp pilus assembly protein TadG
MNEAKPYWQVGEGGTAAAETALTMSVLLLLVVANIEIGRAFWTYNTMLLAVEEAGRYAMTFNHGPGGICRAQNQASGCPILSNTPLANCVAARAQDVASGYQTANIGVSVAENSASFPPTITVCATSSFNFVLPELLPYGLLNFTGQVTVPLI